MRARFRRHRLSVLRRVSSAFGNPEGRHRGVRGAHTMWKIIFIWIFYVRSHIIREFRKGQPNEEEAIGIEEAESPAPP